MHTLGYIKPWKDRRGSKGPEKTTPPQENNTASGLGLNPAPGGEPFSSRGIYRAWCAFRAQHFVERWPKNRDIDSVWRWFHPGGGGYTSLNLRTSLPFGKNTRSCTPRRGSRDCENCVTPWSSGVPTSLRSEVMPVGGGREGEKPRPERIQGGL